MNSAHEATYESFVHALCRQPTSPTSSLLGDRRYHGHWLISRRHFHFATIVAAHGLASGARAPSLVMLSLSLLAPAFAAAG